MSIQQAKRSIENALKHLELPKQDIYKAIADARVELVNALEAWRQGKEVSGCMHQWDAGYTCKRCHKKYNEAGLDLLNCKPPARERVCRQCGKRFDYDAPETREPSTLRSFWASYCPEHRVMRSEKELDSKQIGRASCR